MFSNLYLLPDEREEKRESRVRLVLDYAGGLDMLVGSMKSRWNKSIISDTM